jgi:ATP-dependent DNA helicase RecQ
LKWPKTGPKRWIRWQVSAEWEQKKLDSYGSAFLKIITGDEKPMHPQRRKLAGCEAGTTYDQLMLVQAGLTHGTTGLDKPLSCSASLVAKIAALHSPNPNALLEILGERRAERFASAFLDVLQQAR